MLKNHWTSLKKIEKVVFSIRRMQKECKNDRGTEFWPGPPVGELCKESLLWAVEMDLRLL